MRRVLRGTVAVVVTVGTLALPALPATAGVSREVAVDLRPGSGDTTVNLNGRPELPVAILSTASFDAASVDPLTVCFGDAENATQRDCTEAHGTGHVTDVDGDGDRDLLLHYSSEEAGLDAGDTRACLEGLTLGGTEIHGCDAVAVKNGAPEAQLPDLTVAVVADPASAGPGAVVTWTATVGNEGAGAVTLAPGTRVIGFTTQAGLTGETLTAPAGFTCVALECTNDDPRTLLPGQSVAFPISGTLPSLPGPVSVEATVDPGLAVAESDETDNTRSATAVVEPGNLTATLTANPGAVAPGETLVLTATVRNDGAVATHVPAGTAVAAFDLPAGFTPSAITGPTGVACTGVTCATTAARTLAPGAALTLGLTVAAPADPAEYTAAVVADPDGALTESDEADNRATALLLVEAANLVTTVATVADPVGSSGPVEWTAELVNLGPGRIRIPAGTRAISLSLSEAVSGVTVTGPAGYTCAAVTTTEYACDADALTTLLAGDRAAFTLRGTAPATPGSVTLTATADPLAAVREADETDNVATSTATVVAGNLTVSASPVANPVDAFTSTTWNATVTNTGGAMDIPSGTHLVRFVWPDGAGSIAVSTPAGYSCFVVATNTADCSTTAATTIPAGGTVPLVVFARAPRTPGPMSFVFTVDPLGVIGETNEADNVATATTIVQPPDLSTTLTVTPDPGEAGFSTTWVARIANDGPAVARIGTGMTLVRFAVPAGTTSLAVSTPTGYTCFLADTLVVDCTTTASHTIDAGSFVEVTFFGTASREPGTMTLTATADPHDAIPEADETDNAATRSLTTRGPDLTTTLGVTPDPVLANQTSTWVARVTNDGPSRARVPSGTTLLRLDVPTTMTSLAVSTPANITCFLAATAVVECTTTVSRTLAVGETIAFTLFGTMRAPGTAPVTATADPHGAVPEEDETNNAVAIEPVVRGPNLTTAVTVTPDPVLANQTATFVATVTNAGPAQARFVTGTAFVRFDIPSGMSSLAVSTPAGYTCFLAETLVVQCDTTATQLVAGGSSVAITLFATPRALAPASLTVTADPGGVAAEENETDNAATVAFDPLGPNLTVSTTATPDPADQDHTMQWVTRITNSGAAPARLVTGTAVVQLAVPTTFSSLAVATPAGFTCFLAATALVECSVTATTTLAAGAFHEITLFATPRAPGSVSVTTTVDPDDAAPEENEGDNTVTTVATVQPPDLRTVLATTTPTVAPGGTMTWTATVVNDGPSRARLRGANEVLRFEYSSALTGVAVTAPTGYSCASPVTGVVACTVTTSQSLAVGDGVAFTFTAAAPPSPGTVTLSATADPANMLAEALESNNGATSSVVVAE